MADIRVNRDNGIVTLRDVSKVPGTKRPGVVTLTFRQLLYARRFVDGNLSDDGNILVLTGDDDASQD